MTTVLPSIDIAERANQVADILRPCTEVEADTVVRVALGVALSRRISEPSKAYRMSGYQTDPFRININGYGIFVAVASEGVIRPKYARAKRTMYDPAVRNAIESFAQSYLKRRDWKWEVPDGMPKL